MRTFLFVLFLFCNTIFANDKTKIIILDFVNQSSQSPQYDLLNSKIANEFRFIFSKSTTLEVLNLQKLYPSLVEIQKNRDVNSYKKIINKIQLYLNSQNAGSFDYIIAGEFLVENKNLQISYRLYQNTEGLKLALERKPVFDNSLALASYWRFQACGEALELVNSFFKREIYDDYTKKCKNPKQTSEILENSLEVYRKIQSLEQEFAFSETSTTRNLCLSQCYNETQEAKILQCLKSCDINYLQDTQKALSKIQIKGYKKLNTTPENYESNWKNFKEESLNSILFILKTLPDDYTLSVQGRVSKDFSNHPKILEVSKQKAETVKERLAQEISSIDKSYSELIEKLQAEGCADLCFSEYPLQLEENSVTFRIRKKR